MAQRQGPSPESKGDDAAAGTTRAAADASTPAQTAGRDTPWASSAEDASRPAPAARPTRRAALFGGGALAGGVALGASALGGAAVGAGAMGLATRGRNGAGQGESDTAVDDQGVAAWADAAEGFYGQRQAGVATAPQAHASFIALDLHAGAAAGDVRRLLRVLTEDAAALTQGEPPLAAQVP